MRGLPTRTIRWIALAAIAGTMLAMPCRAQRIAAEDVLRAESAENFAPRAQKKYVESLVNRLDPAGDPRLILDVIELQLRASIDLGLADKLDTLLSAVKRLSAVAADPARSASIDEQVARAIFFNGHDIEGLEASERALTQQEAVAPVGKHPDPTRLFRHLIEHAQLVASMMRVDKLVTTLKKAEKVLPLVRNPALASIDLDNLQAQAYFALGDLGRVREILSSMLERANRLGLPTWESEVQFAMADMHIAQANYGEAAAASQRALAVYEAQDSPLGVASCLQQLAQIANANDAPAQAAEYATRAIKIFDTLDDIFAKANSRRELAFAAALMGDARTARHLLADALARRPEDTSSSWTYSIARLRTRIALAENDAAAARKALAFEDRLREQRQTERGLRHTQATRALFEVGERELRVQLLERDNEIRKLDVARSEAQISLQRWWIGGGFLLFALSLCAAALLFLRSIALKRAAYTDSLTQVMSRAAILRRLQRTLDRARSSHEPVSVIMLDIDRFKDVNDTYGHSAGDAVLKLAASRISSMLPANYRVGRLGGDEFMVVLPNTKTDEARLQAERMMAVLRELEVDHQKQTLRIGVSMGVASSGDGQGDDLNRLVHAADTALLSAKHGGRDRVVVADMVAAATVG